MSGNRTGGLKAVATTKSLYGADFYRIAGAKGGKLGHTGGFYVNRELARACGRKSKRGPAKSTSSTSSSLSISTSHPLASTTPMTEAERDFAEGFFAPSWKDKILSRLRRQDG